MKSVYIKAALGLFSVTLLSCIFIVGKQKNTVPPLIASLVLEKHIAQVGDNLSGLTWDPRTQTLLAVTNRPAQLIQMDKRGNVITRFPLPDIDDPESISTGWDNSYLIAEERRRKITVMTLSLKDQRYQPQVSSLVFDLGNNKNHGIEGVTFANSSETLFIANEKNPAVIFKIEGFNTLRHQLKIKKIYTSSKDISGLAWSDEKQRLYVLSDEAKNLVEMDSTGTVFRASDLSDFADRIPQPEGVAIHGDTIYIVSEPNYFYVFNMTEFAG